MIQLQKHYYLILLLIFISCENNSKKFLLIMNNVSIDSYNKYEDNYEKLIAELCIGKRENYNSIIYYPIGVSSTTSIEQRIRIDSLIEKPLNQKNTIEKIAENIIRVNKKNYGDNEAYFELMLSKFQPSIWDKYFNNSSIIYDLIIISNKSKLEDTLIVVQPIYDYNSLLSSFRKIVLVSNKPELSRITRNIKALADQDANKEKVIYFENLNNYIADFRDSFQFKIEEGNYSVFTDDKLITLNLSSVKKIGQENYTIKGYINIDEDNYYIDIKIDNSFLKINDDYSINFTPNREVYIIIKNKIIKMERIKL
jgi:hypothetical protein